MSITLYNGFAFDGHVGALLARVREFREVLQPLAEAQLDEFIAAVSPGTTAGAAYGLWLNLRRELRQTQRRNIAVDTDFSLTVFPCNHEGTAWIGIVFTEHGDWWDLWLQQTGVSDFHYQDQSDRPDEIDPAQWRERKAVWSRMLLNRPAPIPSLHGLSIEVVDPMGPLPKHLREAAVKAFERKLKPSTGS